MAQDLSARKFTFSVLTFGSKHYLPNSDAQRLSCKLLLLLLLQLKDHELSFTGCAVSAGDFHHCKDKQILIIQEYDTSPFCKTNLKSKQYQMPVRILISNLYDGKYLIVGKATCNSAEQTNTDSQSGYLAGAVCVHIQHRK